jgi:hypothetical protein
VWDIHFARKAPLQERGNEFLLVTDRHIGCWESANQLRLTDYPLTGIWAASHQLRNYQTSSVQLTNIT